jgi:hypothetical protein
MSTATTANPTQTSGFRPSLKPQEIQPTAVEETFFGHLNDFVREGRLRVEPEIPATECRIAGGWVRDKVCVRYSFPCEITKLTGDR